MSITINEKPLLVKIERKYIRYYSLSYRYIIPFKVKKKVIEDKSILPHFKVEYNLAYTPENEFKDLELEMVLPESKYIELKKHVIKLWRDPYYIFRFFDWWLKQFVGYTTRGLEVEEFKFNDTGGDYPEIHISISVFLRL